MRKNKKYDQYSKTKKCIHVSLLYSFNGHGVSIISAQMYPNEHAPNHGNKNDPNGHQWEFDRTGHLTNSDILIHFGGHLVFNLGQWLVH